MTGSCEISRKQHQRWLEAQKITSLRVERILKANRIRKFTADEVLSALKTAPLPPAPGAAEAPLRWHSSGHAAKRQEKDRRHASGMPIHDPAVPSRPRKRSASPPSPPSPGSHCSRSIVRFRRRKRWSTRTHRKRLAHIGEATHGIAALGKHERNAQHLLRNRSARRGGGTRALMMFHRLAVRHRENPWKHNNHSKLAHRASFYSPG